MELRETWYLMNGLEVPEREAVLTPQEVRAQTQRERREATKARQLDRRTKRQSKRSQAY